ncbi:TonB-linked outer membrane protein, SusC/RagA family [Chitinophaga jiangningensis]|uniref:TonB-linked outer membrane protein, SusC/RagA family n=1 Tax=Chitinophaga jiangningensis TaxID=1419482 RepID=A0A1M7JA30_9BACT|nr:TonB-dependent receptor [Chitinophaga jiangningensis]SHM49856.1 TonB-linked outer membrane protein, SusC/RagA family [Chitinophaga jiangningensis]
MRKNRLLPLCAGFLGTLLFLLCTNYLPAQVKATITGKVVSAENGEPLIGATVILKGTKQGTTADKDGAFTLPGIANATLVVSYLNFEKTEVPVNGSFQYIRLKPSGNIDEVVVVGYATQKKATLTGAVEQVSGKIFESRAVTNIALALQGQTPGLIVTRSSPRPGNEGIAMRIRGATSVNGSDPLIVVDGVPILNNYSFQNLNPDDIENISVLKDGAAAIYGSRAANGVILVTTKRGKGKLKVDYNGNMRFITNGITGYSPNMQEYATMWLEANKEETVPNWWVWGEDNLKKMQQGYEGAYALYGTDFYIYNANRIDEMFAPRYSYQHNLSLSNSTEKSSYRLSFGYADNQGNLATAYDGQKQYNARFNYDYNLTKNLKLETNISLIDAKTSEPSVGLDNTLYAYDMPFFPAKNPYGNWFATFNGVDGGANRNAAAMTAAGGRNNKNSLTGRVDVKLTYQLTKDLALEGLASLQNERFNQERYVLPVQLYNWYNVPTGIGLNTNGTNNVYYTYAWQGTYQYYSALLRYNKTLGKHNIAAMAGINAEKNNTQWVSAQRVGFTDMGVYDISLASTTTQTNSGSKSLNGRYSYLGRLNYNYAEKYLVEIVGRRDGNSRFASGYKFKNFGTVQLGWVFSSEDFMQNLHSLITFGKLRATYGTTGNEASGLGAFDYLSTINIGTAVLGAPASQQQATSLNNNGLISYNRTWEKVKQQNIGIDLNFLSNRLSTNFDYFVKENIGMLVDVTYPSVLGGSAPKTNSGRFRTKGWEWILSWKDSKKDFSYSATFNISNTNTLVSGVEGRDSYNAGRNDIVNGYPYQSWFVFKTDGYFRDQADVDAYYAAYGKSTLLANMPQNNQAVALRPGDTKRVDVAGTKNITNIGNEKSSLVYAGDGTPHYTFGLNLGASYKNFDFFTTFQGQLKQNIMRNGYMAYPFVAVWTNQNPVFLGKTWTEANPEAMYPRLTVNGTRSSWNYGNNDFMLQNNRYIRLKSLILGYTLPQHLTEKAKLNKVRVYFSGNDLWEWTSIKDGFDPEMGEASINSGYPFGRTWSFGLNIGL